MDVASWLRNLGLERYEAVFRENDVDAQVLPILTADDLKDLGIISIGHRRHLLEAIAALRLKGTAAGDPIRFLPRPPIDPARNLGLSETSAERRPLTVMFCDLVGSTALSSRLDPEDLGEVIRTYQACVVITVRQFDGFIARYVGDGVLIYFGWPEARETDAERAVRAGLAVVAAVSEASVDAMPLQVRIGIATGLVVVGDAIGLGESHQQTAVGETPNVAARLQGLAEPNQVVIDVATRRQIGGLFECQDLGTVELKGLRSAVPAWQVLGEGILESRFEALHGSTMTPLVGRDEEVDLLLRRWKQSAAGKGQIVLLTGEPGIGKSRLLVELEARLATEAHVSLRYFCSPLHQSSALYPVIARWKQEAGFARSDTAEQRLRKLESFLAPDEFSPTDVALLADLLGIPTSETSPPPDFTPQQRKERTFAILLRRLQSLAQRQPVLMLFEDALWADHSSLELLDVLIKQIAELPILLVISFRPEFVPSWIDRAGVSLITLTRLDRQQSAALASQVTTSNVMKQAILERIIAQTDGVPLFIEELTKTILETLPDGSPSTLTVPSTLHASLMARLDRLPAARQVAQIGAVIGREFSHTLLMPVAELAEVQLIKGLDELVAAGLVFRRGQPPDVTYTFKHALVQDVAYESLLRTRRQHVHRQIAETVRDHLPEWADAEPEIVAHHFTQAGLSAPAMEWWGKAGSRAIQRSANVEASHYLRAALDIAEAMPAGPERAHLEAELLLSLGVALIASTGYSSDEVGHIFDRARELCRDLDSTGSLFPALHGRYSHVQVAGDIAKAQVLAENFFSLAQQQGHDEGIMVGHRILGASRLMTARFAEAREHLERVCALYDPERHRPLAYRYGQDIRTVAWSYLVLALWHLGDGEQASRLAAEAQAQAEAMSHANSVGQVYTYTELLHALMPASAKVCSGAERLTQVGAEHRLPLWSAVGRYFQGWALADSEDCPRGIAAMHEGLEAMLALNVRQFRPIFLTWLAAAHGRNGEPSIGLELLDEADKQARTGGESWLVPESLRVRGELLLLAGSDNSPAAARCFEDALALARQTESASLTARVLASRARSKATRWW